MKQLFNREILIATPCYGQSNGVTPVDCKIIVNKYGFVEVEANDGGWIQIEKTQLKHMDEYKSIDSIIDILTPMVFEKFKDKNPKLIRKDIIVDDLQNLLNDYRIRNEDNEDIDNEKTNQSSIKKNNSSNNLKNAKTVLKGTATTAKVGFSLFKSVFSLVMSIIKPINNLAKFIGKEIVPSQFQSASAFIGWIFIIGLSFFGVKYYLLNNPIKEEKREISNSEIDKYIEKNKDVHNELLNERRQINQIKAWEDSGVLSSINIYDKFENPTENAIIEYVRADYDNYKKLKKPISDELNKKIFSSIPFLITKIENPSDSMIRGVIESKNLDYLNKHKIKSEELQLDILDSKGYKEDKIRSYFNSFVSPSDKVNLKFIEVVGYEAIRYVKNPSLELQKKAIDINSESFAYIEEEYLTSEIENYAIEKSSYNMNHIKNLTTEKILQFIEINPQVIKYIKNPSEFIQLAAIKKNPNVIGYIHEPSELLQLTAVKQNPEAIIQIHRSDFHFPYEYVSYKVPESVQIEAIKQNWKYINSIQNPSENVIRIANQEKVRQLQIADSDINKSMKMK